MQLSILLKDVEYELISGTLEQEVRGITYDSRKVLENDIFICITGFSVDGHMFASKAIENGAKIIILEREVTNIPNDITVIKVNDTRKVMPKIASDFYYNPSKDFNLIGVTGTNGKTTTVFFIETILNNIGKKTGLIGTIENHVGKKVIQTERTTPESLDLQQLFYEMKNESIDTVIMEVSSHALDLHRVDCSNFNIGVFTNLTQDHLDYHKTKENYLKVKTKLFKMCNIGVINIDDEASEYIIKEATCEHIITYSTIDSNANIYAKDISLSSNGVKYKLVLEENEYDVEFAIPGKFSVYNSLSAIGACYAVGLPIKSVIEALKKVKGVKGRFQSIKSKKGYSVIVDFAHAPDGLYNVLKTIQEFCEGKIITVFGCGGDRDKTKRPIMGKFAGDYSDFCVITSDNPRTEDPQIIINEIEEGIKDTDCPYTTILDREEGIHFALSMAEENDVVLVAGKGHENYQIIGDKKIHFDDIEVVEQFLQGESN